MANRTRKKNTEREERLVALTKRSWATLEKAAAMLGANCDDVLELLVQVDGHSDLERRDRHLDTPSERNKKTEWSHGIQLPGL